MEEVLARGNYPEYAPSSVKPMENSPMAGKTICFLGSSVTAGDGALGNSMADYMGAHLSCNIVKEAVGGTTLSTARENSYIERMHKNLDTNAHFDLFVTQLSTNDAGNNIPMGKMTDGFDLSEFDTDTIIGAIEYIIGYVRKNWDCKIMFYISARFESPVYPAMVEAMFAIAKKWNIGIIDLWSDDAFQQITAEERALYTNDPVHPTMAGYRDWWTPEMERQLLDYYL